MALTTTTTTTAVFSPHITRKYRLRNSPSSRRRSSSDKTEIPQPPTSRGVLLPLPSNLRRRPSRTALANATLMSSLDAVQVGTKRKRIASANENMLTGGRTLRKHKRRRGYRGHDSDGSDMELDDGEEALWMRTEVNDDDDFSGMPSVYLHVCYTKHYSYLGDQYYLNIAPLNQLIRLRKEELCRLYNLNDPTSGHDHLTKQDLADAIINTRSNSLSLRSSPHTGPPSSPSSMGVGEDESDIEESKPVKKPLNQYLGRSFSLNYLVSKKSAHQAQHQKILQRRTHKMTNRAAPHLHSNSTTQSRRSSPTATSSPVVLRLRTRTVSFHLTDKEGTVTVKSKSKHKPTTDSDSDDDRTAEVVKFSPRRLRSRPSSKEQDKRRTTPMRKAKLKETEEGEELHDELDTDDEVVAPVEDLDTVLDDLVPSAIVVECHTARPTRSPDVRSTRLPYDLRRSRTAPEISTSKRGSHPRRHIKVEPSNGASDGDDEETDEATDEEDYGNESNEDMAEEESGTDDISTTEVLEMEPKRLRSGKIIGEDEEPALHPKDGPEGETDDMLSVDLENESNDSMTDVTCSDLSAEEEKAVDAEIDIDDDLQDVTAKALVRRRRDQLVKLCETRGIEAEGTKPQLVEALLLWVSFMINPLKVFYTFVA